MKFKLEIELGNDVMRTTDDVKGALQHAAFLVDRVVVSHGESASILDANGNRVGRWEFYDDEDRGEPDEDPMDVSGVVLPDVPRRRQLTIGELIDYLNQFPESSPIYSTPKKYQNPAMG